MNVVKKLAAYLRTRRDAIVRTVTVSSPGWDPSEGDYTTTEYVEVIDFDKLCNEIDAFGESLQKVKP